jgi:hypothetical protein
MKVVVINYERKILNCELIQELVGWHRVYVEKVNIKCIR